MLNEHKTAVMFGKAKRHVKKTPKKKLDPEEYPLRTESLRSLIDNHARYKHWSDLALRLATSGLFSLADALSIMAERHYRYGADSLLLTGTQGVATRVIDKLCRIRRLMQHPEIMAGRESISDSALDAFNYCILARLLLRKGVL